MRLPTALSRRALLAATAACLSTVPTSPTTAASAEPEMKSALTGALEKTLPSAAGAGSDPLDAIAWNGPKKLGLTLSEMTKAVDVGLREREWFVTGKGMPELFSDSFKFSDPDVSVDGIEPYCRQVRRLFDQNTARAEVICTSATAPNTITITWRNSGKVNLGPGFELKPYVVTTTLKTDPGDGLIVSQVDEFTVSGPDLILYQVPFLRGFTSPPAPSAEILRRECNA